MVLSWLCFYELWLTSWLLQWDGIQETETSSPLEENKLLFEQRKIDKNQTTKQNNQNQQENLCIYHVKDVLLPNINNF